MAEWSTAYINDLPDSAFLYVEAGGSKDEEGKTVPRTLRHFPYKDTNGSVDLPHLRNALSRIPQSNLPSDVKSRLTTKAQRILAEQDRSADRRGGMSTTESEERESLSGGEYAYRATEPEATHLRDDENGAPILEGRMMPYDEWTEIDSSVEGHFMERFSPGSLAKTMNERMSRIRVLFEHGLDRLGRQTIAGIEGFRDESDGAYYRASLLDGLPPLLVSGLRRGLYGSSVRFKPVKWDRIRFPKRSEHNPEGIEERTVREGFVKELSVVTFPQYEGATAMVRSLTDEIAAKQLLGDPERLLEFLRSTNPPTEPPHSESTEPEDQAPVQSRSTQPVHDYLRPEEDDSSWRL